MLPAAAKPFTAKRGAVDFKQVVFRYGETERIFDQLDLSIQPSEKIGLVGPSGGGKTSLLNILGTIDKASSGIVGVIMLIGSSVSRQTADGAR